MSWLKHYREAPSVPDDDRERLVMIADSTERLAEVRGRGARVTDVSGSLRARNDRNSYAQGLRTAFGAALEG